MTAILVLDIGTSGVRSAVVDETATIVVERFAEFLPDTPFDGIVEYDAVAYNALAISVARDVLEDYRQTPGVTDPEIDAIGISNQRASTVVWDRHTGVPVAPAQSWQDLRTIGDCLALQAAGHWTAPNQSITKAANIWNSVDPERERDLCIGTPDSWLVWSLTEGAAHITEPTNVALTGFCELSGVDWNPELLALVDISESALPRIVDSSGELAWATVFGPGRDGRGIPICGIAGDQQASLIGQGGLELGVAKLTFGTGAMLDISLGSQRPLEAIRSEGGTFPIICWQLDGEQTWGLEAVMLSCGTNVQWLRDDLRLIETSADSETVAAQCESTDGVVYVPAQLGLATPHWDYGARGTLLGLTRGTGRPQVVRAVLEGIAHRALDLIEAAEDDGGTRIEVIRVDGAMSDNDLFVQLVADITGRTVEVSPVRDATAIGAAMLAGLALGVWSSPEACTRLFKPRSVVLPDPDLDREAMRRQWAKAIDRARGWYEDLSALDF
ncbi:MAG: FGGY-family carbohydrate kinase [Microthrixaceae bacterium]|nr:hypothetical protein [Microthrixaceae bacterium]